MREREGGREGGEKGDSCKQGSSLDGEGKAKGNKKNPKAMYLKDYERMRLQAKGRYTSVLCVVRLPLYALHNSMLSRTYHAHT